MSYAFGISTLGTRSVGAWHHRTGLPHGAVHAELRQACGGPPAAQATAEQLRARIDRIRAWALKRRG
jgi:hypothetical protein